DAATKRGRRATACIATCKPPERWSRRHWCRCSRASERVARHQLSNSCCGTGERIRARRRGQLVVEKRALKPLVKSLQALRGVRLTTAAVIAAELGDLRRFATAPQLMAYLGLVPSEHSSGESRR